MQLGETARRTRRSTLPSPPIAGLGAPIRLAYGLGQFAEGVKNHCFAQYLLFFYTQVLGLSGSLAGTALLLALLFDGVTDPLVGSVSDRLSSRWGRRHPFLYASALPLALGFYASFSPPEGLGQAGLFAWLLGSTVATRAAMTLFHVPHMALGAELSSDYEERTRIVLARTLFSGLGVFGAGGAALLWYMRPTPDFPNGALNPAAYPSFAALFAVAMAVTIWMSAAATHHRIPGLPGPNLEKEGSLLADIRRDVRQIFRIPSFRALFFGATIVFVAFGMANNLGLHLATYFWNVTPQDLFWWGAGAAVSTLLGILYWTRYAGRNDKKPTFLRGLVIFVVFATLPLFAKAFGLFPAETSRFYLPLFVACGCVYHFGLAATIVTGGSMMADVTDEDEVTHGRRREGLFFGAIAFAAKCSVGLGSFFAGNIIDLVGLVPGAAPEEVAPGVGRNLALADGTLLAILVLLAVACFSRYQITRRGHAEMRAQLDARGQAAP